MEIKLKAPAKINLSLDVRGRRPDGYHELATVMQTVDLYDTITLTDNDSGAVTVSCNYEGVPCDERNICVKAANRFFEACRLPVSGVHIDIDKTIPTQAGSAPTCRFASKAAPSCVPASGRPCTSCPHCTAYIS